MSGSFLLALVLVAACGSACEDGGHGTARHGVVVVGDSITEQSAEAIRHDVGDERPVQIFARIGETFASSQADADTAARESPAVIIIELGTNDVWTETPLDAISNEMERMLAKFAGACIVMVNVNERTENARSLDGTIYDNERAKALNDVVRQRAEHVIDWNATANSDPTRFLDRGTIHPTAEGSVLLASLMDEAATTCAAES